MKKYTHDVTLDLNTTAGIIFNLVGKNKDVLEIGCASGVQSRILKELLGCRVIGVEINAEAAEEARQYCEKVYTGNIEQLDLASLAEGREFDVVLCADVLEHLLTPVKMLEKVKEILKDDGYVVASVPNVVHASVVFQMAKGVFEYTDYGLLDDSHIRFFTQKTICETFFKAGLRVENLERVLCTPTSTELNVAIRTRQDRKMMQYILENNPESLTYQYVLKASKVKPGGEGATFPHGAANLADAQNLSNFFIRHMSRQSSLRRKIRSLLANIIGSDS